MAILCVGGCETSVTYQKVEGSYDAPYLLVALVVARLNRYLWQAMIKYKKSDSDANASLHNSTT